MAIASEESVLRLGDRGFLRLTMGKVNFYEFDG